METVKIYLFKTSKILFEQFLILQLNFPLTSTTVGHYALMTSQTTLTYANFSATFFTVKDMFMTTYLTGIFSSL